MNRAETIAYELQHHKTDEERWTYIAQLIATSEQKRSDMDAYKADVGKVLGEMRDHKSSVETNSAAFHEGVQGALDQMLAGIHAAERRLNGTWNTMNVIIEYIARKAEAEGTSREAFVALFAKIGQELFDQATQHIKSERARIVAEQRAGISPTPMVPVNQTGGSILKLVSDVVENARQALTEEEGANAENRG